MFEWNSCRRWFYSYHNLQGSQTLIPEAYKSTKFYSYHNLQGSQTLDSYPLHIFSFYSYHNLQGSQTKNTVEFNEKSFTLIIIYKVLKPF